MLVPQQVFTEDMIPMIAKEIEKQIPKPYEFYWADKCIARSDTRKDTHAEKR